MKTLYVKSRDEWRSWLEKNGRSCREICLIYYKKNSGKPRIAYDDAVEEALCFGWIDGKTIRIDEERYGQRFTPRNPKSHWSPINIRRAKRLIKEGKMTEAGLGVFDPSRKTEPSRRHSLTTSKVSSKLEPRRGKTSSSSRRTTGK